MEIMFGAKDYKITYKVANYEFTSTVKAMDSIDAKRRFERRMGFEVVSVTKI